MSMYYVWLTDAPEEGASVYHATTATGAIVAFLRDVGDVGPVEAKPVRPGDGWAGTGGWCGSTDVVDVEWNPVEGAHYGLCGGCAKPREDSP